LVAETCTNNINSVNFVSR